MLFKIKNEKILISIITKLRIWIINEQNKRNSIVNFFLNKNFSVKISLSRKYISKRIYFWYWKILVFQKEKFLNRNSLTINLTFFAEFTYYHFFSERSREQKETKDFQNHSECLKNNNLKTKSLVLYRIFFWSLSDTYVIISDFW